MQNNFLIMAVVLQSLVISCLQQANIISTWAMQVQLSNSDPAFELQSTKWQPSDAKYDGPVWKDSSTLMLMDFNHPYAVGRVVYSKPIQFINQTNNTVSSFSTYFTFQIGTVRYGLNGDGMAFFFTPEKELPASGYTQAGLFGVFPDNSTDPSRHILALEFDTYRNLDLSDSSASHIGLDINGVINLSSLYDTGAKESDELYLYKNSTLHTWMEYDGNQTRIDIRVSSDGRKPSSSTLNYQIDLSTLFVDQMYVGISADAGVQNNGISSGISVTILSWNFTIDEQSKINPTSPRYGLFLIVVPVIFVVVLITVIAIVVMKSWQRKAMVKLGTPSAALSRISTSVRRYSYRELSRATKGFVEEQKIGQGGFSVVYKGVLPDGSLVAVKKLKKEGVRMEADFTSEASTSELEIICRIRHRNLMELQGWCYERGEAMLVYKYMGRGTLESYIFRGVNTWQGCMLGGEKRREILIRVAAALEYLHEGLGERVLHRDVKAANVMLTDEWEVKLGDFGLSRLIKQENRSAAVTMTAAGTPGYVAPELFYVGRANEKADVYSFGVLVLEVACGRRVRDVKLKEEGLLLMEWVWRLHQNDKLLEALDPALQSEIRLDPSGREADKWRCVLNVGLLCCWAYPERRPSMRQAYQALRDTAILRLPSVWDSYIPTPAITATTTPTTSSSGTDNDRR